jgi:hypothetical protein
LAILNWHLLVTEPRKCILNIEFGNFLRPYLDRIFYMLCLCVFWWGLNDEIFCQCYNLLYET